MNPNLRFLGNRILLRVLPVSQNRYVHLVEQWHPSANAVVVAVGSGIKVPLKVGDRVGFRPMQGQDLEWEGVRYRMVEERDIVGVVGAAGVEVEGA